jgi:AcrR family transcriptional regulator
MPVAKPSPWKPSTDRILDAAEKSFAKHGYDGVPLRQLIADAKISTTAFYARFASKEDVLASLTWRWFASLHEGAPAAIAASRDLETGIDAGIDFLCEQLGERKPLVRLILTELGASASAIETRQRAYELMHAFLASRFTSLVKSRKLRTEDPSALAWALIGALEMQVMRWAVWKAIELPALREQLRVTARVILGQVQR